MVAVQLAIIYVFSKIDDTSALVHETAYLMVGFLAITAILIIVFNTIGTNLGLFDSGQQFLVATTIRLLMSMVFVLVLVYNGVENKITFVINFFLLYLSYMLFEIIPLMTNLREISGGTDKQSKND